MISVILPTRNPHSGRFDRTLAGLAAQTLPPSEWELLVVDNGSEPPIVTRVGSHPFGRLARVVVEPTAGLTPARLAGIREARGEVLVFVDDDNVPAPDYLAIVTQQFSTRPKLAAAGGAVLPEWEQPPPTWSTEFHRLLALRDLGREERIACGGPTASWPEFAPVGAGLAIRRSHATAYATVVGNDPQRLSLDRRATSLASGGDNDLVFTALHSGGDVAYFPALRLTHLIPVHRLDARYLAQLNRGIMRTWIRVLALHKQCPWPPIARWTVTARALRAWVRHRAWRGPAERIRWQGARGQFEGQADLTILFPATR